MTKADIAEALYKNVDGLTKAQASEYIDLFFDQLKQTLASGESVKLSGFGTFTAKDKKERIGRNPQTGEALLIDARRIVSFKPSNILRKTVNS